MKLYPVNETLDCFRCLTTILDTYGSIEMDKLIGLTKMASLYYLDDEIVSEVINACIEQGVITMTDDWKME